MTAEWKKFKGAFDGGNYRYPYLSVGDECRFSYAARKLGGKVGIFVKATLVNWKFKIDGQNWYLPPSIIAEFRSGTSDTKIEAWERPVAASTGVEKGRASEAGLIRGDVILCSRCGRRGPIFDVVRFKSMKQTRFSGTCMSSGTDYNYEDTSFVQKLDKSLFSGEKK